MKIIIIGFIAVLIYLSGRWLNKLGKPYNVVLLTAHKLISFCIVIYIIIHCFQFNDIVKLSASEWTLWCLLIMVNLAAVISGGVLSSRKQLHSSVQLIHKVSALTSAIVTGVLLFLLRY